MGIKLKFLKFFCEFLFAHRFIKNVEFFLLESVAKNTIGNSPAISQKRAVAASFAIVGKKQAVSPFHIYAFIAEFSIENVRAVHAVAAVIGEPDVHTVFIIFGIKHEVAIFAVARVIDVGRINFIPSARFVEMGRHAHERMELFKKSFGKIKGGEERWVPIVFMPRFNFIHRHRRIRFEMRNYIAAGFIALSLIKIALVAEG